MPFFLIAAGLLLTVSAVRGTQGQLFTLVKGEFTGKNNFLEWMLAIGLIGAIGIVPQLRKLSWALLTLVLVAIFLKKGQGFFDQLQSAVKST